MEYMYVPLGWKNYANCGKARKWYFPVGIWLFFPIWTIILLTFHSTNKLFLLVPKILQILGRQPPISSVFLNLWNIFSNKRSKQFWKTNYHFWQRRTVVCFKDGIEVPGLTQDPLLTNMSVLEEQWFCRPKCFIVFMMSYSKTNKLVKLVIWVTNKKKYKSWA